MSSVEAPISGNKPSPWVNHFLEMLVPMTWKAIRNVSEILQTTQRICSSKAAVVNHTM